MNNLINVKDLTIKQLEELTPLGYCFEYDSNHTKNCIGISAYVALREKTDEEEGIVATIVSTGNNLGDWEKEAYLRFLKNFMGHFSKRTAGIDFDMDYIVTSDKDMVLIYIPSWNEASDSIDFEAIAVYYIKDKTLKASYGEAFKFIKRLLEEFSKRITKGEK